jgi:hypothetical protein
MGLLVSRLKDIIKNVSLAIFILYGLISSSYAAKSSATVSSSMSISLIIPITVEITQNMTFGDIAVQNASVGMYADGSTGSVWGQGNDDNIQPLIVKVTGEPGHAYKCVVYVTSASGVIQKLSNGADTLNIYSIHKGSCHGYTLTMPGSGEQDFSIGMHVQVLPTSVTVLYSGTIHISATYI